MTAAWTNINEWFSNVKGEELKNQLIAVTISSVLGGIQSATKTGRNWQIAMNAFVIF